MARILYRNSPHGNFKIEIGRAHAPAGLENLLAAVEAAGVQSQNL